MYERNGSIHLFRIPKAKIKNTRLIRGRPGKETLEQMFSGIPDPKPDILVNANLFNMADGWTLVAMKVDGQVIREKSARNYGYVVAGKGPEIKFITLDGKPFTQIAKEFDWAFETGPLLLPTLVANQMDSAIVTGKHPRTAIGFDNEKNEYVVLVTDGRPFGLTCTELAAELRNHSVDVAVNLDGGGSSKILFKGKAINQQSENRPIDAAIAIWLADEPAPQTKKTVKIAIDAGHGPETPGKRTPDGTMREFHFNSVVAKYVVEMLQEYDGVELLTVHEPGRDVPLKDRTDKANAWGANVYVSIHANAYETNWNDVKGIETYIYNRGGQAEKIAEKIHAELIKITGRPNRGIKTANFHVLRETKMPSILTECGFMTNKEEAEFLKSNEYRRKCAQAIVNGLVAHFGLAKKAPHEPEKKALYRVQVGAFSSRENAEKLAGELRQKGYHTIIKEE